MERLTLEQATSHCIERSDCTECGKQHQQLAEWLEELKYYKELKAQDRLIELSESGIGNLSDGYHTFNELYHHRAILFSVICNNNPSHSWKAKKHHDGTMYDGMFIVGINTPIGQATYHYDIEPYWDMFKVPEAEYAPEWDGHTPSDAIERISKLAENAMPTAYDIDKVVEQLEERKQKEGNVTLTKIAYNTAIEDAIEIVKGGVE